MKKFLFLFILATLASCKKEISQEEAMYYKEDDTPIDTTVIDSVVGQASFDAINSKIENAKKDTVMVKKKDSVKTTEQKIADTKKKLEEANKKSKKDEKLAKEKEKLQQQKKVDELIQQTPED
jgi:hypothetical protein